jgi:hypothetical protein
LLSGRLSSLKGSQKRSLVKLTGCGMFIAERSPEQAFALAQDFPPPP